MSEFRKFKDVNIELLKDPIDANRYLELALDEYDKDKDREALLLAFDDIQEAQEKISHKHR